MSQITDFLPQYRELNTLFANTADGGKIGYEKQQVITEFWNVHGDIKTFEKMVLDIVLEKDKPTCTLLLSGIKAEVENNIRLYESVKEVLDSIDTEKICKERAEMYDNAIKNQQEAVTEYYREMNQINGSLDAIGFREHTPQQEERLWQQHEYIAKRHKEEQEKLAELYKLQQDVRQEAAKYRINLFEKIYLLSITFLKIIDCYVIPNTVSIENKTITKRRKRLCQVRC